LASGTRQETVEHTIQTSTDLANNGQDSITVETYAVSGEVTECSIETRVMIKTHPYTEFKTVDPVSQITTTVKGQWEEISVTNPFGITLNDGSNSQLPGLSWEVSQDLYIHWIVPTFAPHNGPATENVSIPPSVRVQFRFHTMDPTNP
jgi:hypothetical protein